MTRWFDLSSQHDLSRYYSQQLDYDLVYSLKQAEVSIEKVRKLPLVFARPIEKPRDFSEKLRDFSEKPRDFPEKPRDFPEKPVDFLAGQESTGIMVALPMLIGNRSVKINSSNN